MMHMLPKHAQTHISNTHLLWQNHRCKTDSESSTLSSKTGQVECNQTYIHTCTDCVRLWKDSHRKNNIGSPAVADERKQRMDSLSLPGLQKMLVLVLWPWLQLPASRGSWVTCPDSITHRGSTQHAHRCAAQTRCRHSNQIDSEVLSWHACATFSLSVMFQIRIYTCAFLHVGTRKHNRCIFHESAHPHKKSPHRTHA
jgi:hypothetical protein